MAIGEVVAEREVEIVVDEAVDEVVATVVPLSTSTIRPPSLLSHSFLSRTAASIFGHTSACLAFGSVLDISMI